MNLKDVIEKGIAYLKKDKEGEQMEMVAAGLYIQTFISVASTLRPYLIKYAPELKKYIKSISKNREITYECTFQHFPEPFVTPKSFDLLFVLGGSKEKISLENERIGGWGAAEMDNATRLVDLATFLGVKAGQYGIRIEKPMIGYLDSEIPDNVKRDSNLISIGGGDINEFTAQLQIIYSDNIPIHFDNPQSATAIISRISQEVYVARGRGRNVGFIELLPNPFNPRKVVMVLAGNFITGTQAAFLALMKYPTEVQKNNRYDRNIPAKIVEGMDTDNDGIIDDVTFLE